MRLGASSGFETFVRFPHTVPRNRSLTGHNHHGSWWIWRPTDEWFPSHMDSMGAPKTPRPPQLVGEVLETVQLPDNLVRAFSDQFWVTRGEGGPLSAERRYGRVIHALLGNQAYRLEPSPGMEHLTLLGVNRDGTVYVLHSFFSVPVGRYSTDRRLLDFSGDRPMEGIPPMMDLPMASFTVRHVVCAVTREDHIFHIEGIPPSSWKMTPCNRAENNTESRDLTCLGITLFPLYGDSWLLGLYMNISDTSQLLSPLLYSWALPYNNKLNWLQFSYTGDRLGAYRAPGYTELEFDTLSEGDLLFALVLYRLQNLYPESYARRSTSTIGPLGLEYELEWLTSTQEEGTSIYLPLFSGDPSTIWAHERRETYVGSKAGAHARLSSIIHDYSPGLAQERRGDSYEREPIHPPPSLPQRGDPWPNLGWQPHTPYPRGEDPCKKFLPRPPGYHLSPVGRLCTGSKQPPLGGRRDGLLIMVRHPRIGTWIIGTPPPHATTPRGVSLAKFGSPGTMSKNDG